jgi:glutamine synthetase
VAPRGILRAQLERARGAGLLAKMGSELEFFLFREGYSEARGKGYRQLLTKQDYIEDYHLLSATMAEDVIGAIRRDVDGSGIPVEFSKGEWGPGQHEINLHYAPALEMADRHVVYKQAAKEIAFAQGHAVTFMAKWNEQHAGNSCSDVFRFALGGLLAHARELTWFFAPNPNSYKRYRAGTFAPTGIAWSLDNRTAGFRIVGHGPSLRIECRIPGADANPYLVYAALLAAALDGIERELDPGPPFRGDVYAAEGLPRLPTSLPESLRELEGSAFARKAFGDDVIDHLLHFARSELSAVDSVVTDAERARYFERI